MNMKKHSTLSSIKIFILYLLVLVFFCISGCAGVGSTVPPERRLPLIETENSQGSFSYGGLKVKYSYSLAGSDMIMDGVASYNHGYDSLDIRISFLDATGTLLQREFIYSSGYRTAGKRRSGIDFQKTFTVPAGSAAITFSSFAQDRSGR
jgi:hypothetical protein